MLYETFAPLTELTGVTHAFSLRTAEDSKAGDFAARLLMALDFDAQHFAAAEQTHGNGVAVVRQPTAQPVPGVDALVTDVPGLPLLIRCADCAAVFLVDRARPAIGLAHSGKAGTLANVVGATLRVMEEAFGTRPEDCRAFISPSIGPCHYEMDIWTKIETQLRVAGVSDIHNPRLCTACHLARYFSYRAEKGHTGRMLGLLAL